MTTSKFRSQHSLSEKKQANFTIIRDIISFSKTLTSSKFDKLIYRFLEKPYIYRCI